jgi:hypothetical protein
VLWCIQLLYKAMESPSRRSIFETQVLWTPMQTEQGRKMLHRQNLRVVHYIENGVDATSASLRAISRDVEELCEGEPVLLHYPARQGRSSSNGPHRQSRKSFFSVSSWRRRAGTKRRWWRCRYAGWSTATRGSSRQ